MEDKRYLTFALGKGRLAKKTLELFEKIGITCEEIKVKLDLSGAEILTDSATRLCVILFKIGRAHV